MPDALTLGPEFAFKKVLRRGSGCTSRNAASASKYAHRLPLGVLLAASCEFSRHHGPEHKPNTTVFFLLMLGRSIGTSMQPLLIVPSLKGRISCRYDCEGYCCIEWRYSRTLAIIKQFFVLSHGGVCVHFIWRIAKLYSLQSACVYIYICAHSYKCSIQYICIRKHINTVDSYMCIQYIWHTSYTLYINTYSQQIRSIYIICRVNCMHVFYLSV